MNKPNAIHMLLEVDSQGLTSLWDYTDERAARPGFQRVVLFTFNDGSVGLLPEKQATALSDLLDYNWENEELDYAQCGDGQWDGEGNHIVHAYRALGYEGGPNQKPYLDSQD